MLYELKKVALGEFLDDVNLGTEIMKTFGIHQNPQSSSDEQVGENRLGMPDFFARLGPTFLLATIVFLLLIAIVLIAIFVSRRIKSSQKCARCIMNFKTKIFYNPIIRYSIINALKLTLAAMVGLKAAGKDKKLAYLPILQLALISAIPLIFLYVTYNK